MDYQKMGKLTAGLFRIDTSIRLPLSAMKSSNSDFDTECRHRYGDKTCILYQIDNDNVTYQARVLDGNGTDGNNNSPYIYKVEKNSFYVLIPKLLVQNYTVVIVEKLNNIKDITAVHLPVQIQLSNPPIIQ